MNKMVLIGMFSLVVGCVPSANNMSLRHPTLDDNKIATSKKEPDSFDKAGFILADGSRVIWNSAKSAWEWIDSYEHKDELKRVYEITKSMIIGGYDAARDEMNKQEKEGK